MVSKALAKQSQATRMKILFKQYETTFKRHQDLAVFREPIAFLHRRTGRVEFYDNVTSGDFSFTHTDGTEKQIPLTPAFLKTFDYGKRTFKGYILDEDNAFPLPQTPFISIEQYTMGMTKMLNNFSKWKQKEFEGIGNMWWKILIGLAVLVGVIVVGKMLLPDLKLNPFSKDTAEGVAEIGLILIGSKFKKWK